MHGLAERKALEQQPGNERLLELERGRSTRRRVRDERSAPRSCAARRRSCCYRAAMSKNAPTDTSSLRARSSPRRYQVMVRRASGPPDRNTSRPEEDQATKV